MLNRILATLVFLTGIGAVSADGGPLTVYWTRVAAVAANPPPGAGVGAWNEGGAVLAIPADGIF